MHTPACHSTEPDGAWRLDNGPHRGTHPLCTMVMMLLCLVVPAHAQQPPEEAPPSTTNTVSSRPEPTGGTNDDRDGKSAGSHGQTPNRLFGVLPNYTTVEDHTTVPPITTKATFRMAAQNSFDPFVFPFVGVVAAVAQAGNQDKSLGQGAAAYGKRYATALADNSIGSFLTTAIFPAVLRQDPRYFASGKGSILRRVGYAASRSVITRDRSGQRQFNYAEIGGNGVAAAISNLYYPPDGRSPADTLTRWGTQIMWDTLSNELKELWPDIRRKIHRH